MPTLTLISGNKLSAELPLAAKLSVPGRQTHWLTTLPVDRVMVSPESGCTLPLTQRVGRVEKQGTDTAAGDQTAAGRLEKNNRPVTQAGRQTQRSAARKELYLLNVDPLGQLGERAF